MIFVRKTKKFSAILSSSRKKRKHATSVRKMCRSLDNFTIKCWMKACFLCDCCARENSAMYTAKANISAIYFFFSAWMLMSIFFSSDLVYFIRKKTATSKLTFCFLYILCRFLFFATTNNKKTFSPAELMYCKTRFS